ncbi:hypothetical protein [Streptomyces sp. SP18CS02]|uniref:hypothetical protein n=1 Tax=Streptomyces sp. SP18CS02 TaxID=3002531 RepID=UPI002E795478|nr:hypothetical protein [Streptomyces sp. SP18CS02]MEE1757441.1 hypothetical protein [Streptomyces sp. SP18CS02]
MSPQLRETAGELAGLLWREHTIYRERAGGVVIRGEHVQRWISLAPAGGRDEILVRAGRILEGGTTAPARSEMIVPLTAGTGELAATCRRLLAEAAADAAPRVAGPAARKADRSGGPGRTGKRRGSRRTKRPARGGRHTGLASWAVLACVAALLALYLHGLGLFGG